MNETENSGRIDIILFLIPLLRVENTYIGEIEITKPFIRIKCCY